MPMVNILCEAASGSGVVVLAGAIGASVVAAAKGLEYGIGHVRRRNGGNGKPGSAPACIGHLERLKGVEVELKHVRKGQERIEKKLDQVLQHGNTRNS